MDLIRKFGEEIEEAWRGKDYNEEAFPALAADALRRANIPSKISAWEVIEWTLRQTELPPQKDPKANFGDPPITLFVAPRFYIDVYFWLDGTTQIHQHGFAGAFQVLLGSSIHSWYEFERDRAINLFTETGKISLKVCELLKLGDVQEIRAGREYIHSLFHVDQPSATLVVRTDKSPLHLPQFSYHKPWLALDPFYEEQTLTRKLQSIAVLFQVDREDADQLVTVLLEKSDLQTSFAILSQLHAITGMPLGQLFNLGSPVERFRGFIEIVQDRHGIDFTPIFEHRDRTNEIVRRRGYVTNAGHRFFLALLLNVEGRERILGLVADRFPDVEPIERILDWTYELAQTRVAGVNTPNALGIENFDDLDLTILEHLLRGRSDEELINAVGAEYGEARTSNADITSKLSRIRESAVLQPLLA